MPLGTLHRTPPPFFPQGPTALSKLAFFSALAIFLMVADLRFALVKPMRTVLSTALYPVQWLVMQPIEATRQVGHYFESQNRGTGQSRQKPTATGPAIGPCIASGSADPGKPAPARTAGTA